MTCPGCNSRLGRESLLGSLGNVRHYRCRYCGVGCSKTTRPKDVFGRPVAVRLASAVSGATPVNVR